jgi:hypothetical protein
MVLAISILIYIISAISMWNWIRIAYSSKGVYYNINPDVWCIIFTLFPILNTIGALSNIGTTPYRMQHRPTRRRIRTVFYNKFFKIRKD